MSGYLVKSGHGDFGSLRVYGFTNGLIACQPACLAG